MTKSDLSSAVVEIWKETLQLSEIDLDRTFVDLGGTSLLANQLVAKIAKRLGIHTPVIRVFEYPTLRQLIQFLAHGAESKESSAPTNISRKTLRKSKKSGESLPNSSAIDSTAGQSAQNQPHDIAIVGMACRFPGAKNVDEFWKNLIDGKNTIRILSKDELSPEVPIELKNDPRYVPACGMIDQPYGMDAVLFETNPMEAKLIDPQQRVLLETAWEALEHAGEAPGSITEKTAVFAGVEDNTYYKSEIMPYPDAEKRAGRFSVMTGNEKDFVAMRIAHKLNLKGPAVSVHTACSTSLVAVIMACKSLRYGECDMAIAGGASVHFPTPEGYYYQEGGVFSPDGTCRPFDQEAQGTIFTDGAGIVVLKRLEDAIRDHNTIYAVIKGGAINSDGGDKVSFSAPSISGQASCIADALKDARVSPETLQYVEAHGTATPVGDPIEVEGLRQAFGKDLPKKQFCGLGSVKSNIGHTTTAAGVASLIKTALALKNEIIPATLHYKNPNPGLDLENSPFYITSQNKDWKRDPDSIRRAGLSSFGIGGTNSHLILEEAPLITHDAEDIQPQIVRPFEILPVSAKTASARNQLIENLKNSNGNVRDLAYTLQVGRTRLKHRGACVRFHERSIEDIAVTPTQTAIENPKLVLMFPGQGSQYIEMGKSLYENFPEFRNTFDVCSEILSRELEMDFKKFIFDASNQETLENTRYTQPALFSIEVSIGRMLLDWGIEPQLMIGHSIGEFAAAHLAGVFSLEDGLKLISARGRLMASLPRGKMLSARAPHETVLAAAGEPVDVASINSPVHCVLAGENEKIARIQARLEAAGIPCKLLHTSHAFHSQMMSPVVEPFAEIARQVRFQPPRFRIISTVTGLPMLDSEATDPNYWANHLRTTVRFSPALVRSMEEGGNVYVEIGPRTTLASLASQHFSKAKDATKNQPQPVAISTLSDKSDAASELGAFGTALAKIWANGIELSWNAIWGNGDLIPTVTYPFEKKDYRFSEGRPARTQPLLAAPSVSVHGTHLTSSEQTASPASPLLQSTTVSTEELLDQQLKDLFSEYSGLPVEELSTTFIECGLDSLVLMQIGVELGKRYGVSVSLRDLMEKHNTIQILGKHILGNASPDKLPKPITSSIAQPTPQQPAPTLAPLAAPIVPNGPVAPMPTEIAQMIRLQLHQMKEVMEMQLKYLDRVANGNSSSQSTEVVPKKSKLIRAKHVVPPTAGAFRGKSEDGSEAWYVYNSGQQQYTKFIH